MIFVVGTLLQRLWINRQIPIYTTGTPSKNVAQNGGYAARYNATAGFAKIPENQITLNHGMVQQNAGYTDASGEYNGWKE